MWTYFQIWLEKKEKKNLIFRLNLIKMEKSFWKMGILIISEALEQEVNNMKRASCIH